MILLLLWLLIAKHFVADFVLQSDFQVEQKGTYGAVGGIEHAIIHGIMTTLILCCFVEYPASALLLGALDSLVHYHIDYVKARFGTRDPNTKRFWTELGFDQFCHYTFYLWLAWVLHPVVAEATI